MKKRGFTLVELLAVIVILAIIGLISVPIILGIIDKAKIGAAKDSFNGYMNALELSLAQKEIKGEIQLNTGRYNVTKDTMLSDVSYPSMNEIVNIKGDKPTGTDDYIVLDDKKNVIEAELTILGYVIKYENGEINSITKTGEIGLKNIKLNFDNQTMEKGSMFEIKVECEPSNATNQKVVYKSNDESIAKVDENGLVTALKAGTTKITVTSEANKAIKKEISITVIVSSTGLTLNKESDEIYVSETVQLIGTLEPSDTTTNALSWTSSNPLVASVDENGLVTGRSEGETVITATTQNNITATFNVKVKLNKVNLSIISGKTNEILQNSNLEKSPSNISSFNSIADDGVLNIVVESNNGKKTYYNIDLIDSSGNEVKSLRNFNDTYDTIEQVNGKWGIYRRIEVEEIKTAISAEATNYSNIKRFKIILAKKAKNSATVTANANLLCSHYKSIDANSTYHNSDIQGVAQWEVNNYTLAIRDNTYSPSANISSYRNYLTAQYNNGTPVTILYPLTDEYISFIEFSDETNNMLNSIYAYSDNYSVYVDSNGIISNITNN